MAVTSGFFNSVNHDRLYNAEQMSSIFDGIINDGVFEFVGDAFSVTPNTNVNNSVIVGTGRAWFDHTWTVNDAPFEITLEAPSLVFDRIDAIVIDIDRRDSIRKNSIIFVTGTPANDPKPPTMLKEERHTQYPVAYVTVHPGDGSIIQTGDIEYNVGKSVCPLVTGPLEVVNSDMFFSQMNSNFELFKDGLDEEFQIWFDGIKDLIDDLEIGNINLVNSVDNVTIEWVNRKLQVKDRGITRKKLSFDLQSAIGVLDPTDWQYQDYYDYVNSLTDSGEEETFISQYLTTSVVNSWTAAQISNFYDILKSDTSKNKLWDGVNWNGLPISDFRELVVKFGSSKYSSMIGKTIHLQMGSHGAHDFRVIGVNHDNLTDGTGKALLTFQSTDIVSMYKENISLSPGVQTYSLTPLRTYVEGLIDSFDSDVRSLIKQVSKEENYVVVNGSGSNYTNTYYPTVSSPSKNAFNSKVWLISDAELSESPWGQSLWIGSPYDYWTQHDALSYRIMKLNGAPTQWITRNIQDYWSSAQYFQCPGAIYRTVSVSGDVTARNDSGATGLASVDFDKLHDSAYKGIAYIVPCFCI